MKSSGYPLSRSLAPMGRNCNKKSELTRSEEQIIMKDFSMSNEIVSTDTSSLHDPWGAGFGADNCSMKTTSDTH